MIPFTDAIYRFSYFPTDIGDISSGSHDPKLLSYYGSLVMIEMKALSKKFSPTQIKSENIWPNHNMQSLDKTSESLGDTLVSSGPSKTMMRHDSLPPLHSEFCTFVWLSWLQNEGHRRCGSLDQKANRRILPSAGSDAKHSSNTGLKNYDTCWAKIPMEIYEYVNL